MYVYMQMYILYIYIYICIYITFNTSWPTFLVRLVEKPSGVQWITTILTGITEASYA